VTERGDATAIDQLIADGQLRFVRFGYCDAAGVIRCKAVSASSFPARLTEGVSLSRAQMALSLLDELVHVEGMEPVGEIRLIPDPETFVMLPWLRQTGSMLCDQVSHDGQEWDACPRTFLKQAVERFNAIGITVQAAFEPEFYVVRPDSEAPGGYRAVDRAPVYSSIGHDMFADLMDEICAGLEGQGIQVEQAINEYGAGQLELAVRHQRPVVAADQALRTRDTVRAYARRHGLVASFAPKPFPDGIGSGQHVHLSLWDHTGNNILYDGSQSGGLSTRGRGFVAGLLEHLPALVALTTPSFNSYRRFASGQWASATTSWGYDNREAAIRVSSPFRGREAGSFNVEVKPCDGSANPYLALGALLLAGLDGIERQLDPPPPALSDPERTAAADRERLSLRPLPGSLAEALDNLAQDPVLRNGLGEFRYSSYMAVKRSEAERFSAESLDFELRHHFAVL
jgi:glutamine synthetase